MNDFKNKKNKKIKKNQTTYRVDPDWWKENFGNLYLITDARSVCDENLTKQEVDLIIKFLRPKKSDKFLDVCCGYGRHALELARRGFVNITGLDYSSTLLEKAKKQAKKEKLEVKFDRGDARNLPYQDESFNFVINMGNSFSYWLDEEDDKRFLQEVFRVLKPKGVFLMDITDGEYMKKILKIPSYVWHQATDDIFVLRRKEYYPELKGVVSREIVLSKEKGLLKDYHYFVRLYTPNAISRLLKKVGFGKVIIYKFSTKKKDNLEFMSHRMWIISKKR
jgi:D-alanine-D-alanine ligase